MIFGIDVRKRICKQNEEYMEYIELKTRVGFLRDEEKNPDAKSALSDICDALDILAGVKKESLREEINQFEKDFVKDIFENEGFYKSKNK